MIEFVVAACHFHSLGHWCLPLPATSCHLLPFSFNFSEAWHVAHPQTASSQVYKYLFSLLRFSFSFSFSSSPVLFAIWLRSSVVSVLFSLISEIHPKGWNLWLFYFLSSAGQVIYACHDDLAGTVSLTLYYCLVMRNKTSFHQTAFWPWAGLWRRDL